MDKKGVSPVVATALLLVVAVVAVTSFQGWFTSYQSSVFSDTELKSNEAIDGTLKIDSLIGDTVYIINNVQDNLSIKELKIGENTCNFNDNLFLGMNNISVSDCLASLSTSTPDIVLITDKQIVTKKVLIKSISSSLSSIETEYCLKDNKSGCIGYYIETTADSMDIVNDTVHGLYWQKNASSGGQMTWSAAKNYCEVTIGNGWRLPTLVEMETSLVDVNTGGTTGPYIMGGNSLFTNVQNTTYWTDTKYASSYAYSIYFNWGLSGYVLTTENHYVLCVKTDNNKYIFGNTQTHNYESGTGQIRTGTEFLANSSTCGGDWTMYDNITNLCWTMNSTTSIYTWTDAQSYCDNSILAGGAWRLPEKTELITLLYHNGVITTASLLNSIGFNNIASGAPSSRVYWSNTKFPPFPNSKAYIVQTGMGCSADLDITTGHYVLCVKDPS